MRWFVRRRPNRRHRQLTRRFLLFCHVRVELDGQIFRFERLKMVVEL